ncbi:hypothetical protein ACWGH2_16435 [Streptomyces sp. NPDC054871]
MADDLSKIALWDPDEITVFVQRGTHPHDLIRELHALLVDLGAPIVPGAGVLCFCGTRVELPELPGPQTVDASTL